MVTLNTTADLNIAPIGITPLDNSVSINNDQDLSIQQVPDLIIGKVPDLIIGSENPDVLFGTPEDDRITALGGDDTIIGTTGNDAIDGGEGFDTIDYSDFGEAVTILTAGSFDNGADTQLDSVENFIGAIGQTNTIDGSASTGDTTSLNVDLGNNSVAVENVPGVGTINLEVENFVKVVGTAAEDRLIGDNADNKLKGIKGDDELTGGGGNDTLVGGSGSDRLNGTDSLLKGAGEQDRLSGGKDGDRFILGDENGSFYSTEGDSDFAKITDFSFGDTIQLSREERYSVTRTGSGFNLLADRGEEKELVAKVQFSFSNTSSVSSRSISQISSDSSSSFDNQIELPSESFQLDSGESLDIFTAA